MNSLQYPSLQKTLITTSCGLLFFAVLGPFIGGLPFTLHPAIALFGIYPFAIFPAAIAGILHSLLIRLLLKQGINFTHRYSGFAYIIAFGLVLGALCGVIASFTILQSDFYIFIPCAISGGVCGIIFAPWAFKRFLST